MKVYPNVANLARYELAVQRHRTAEIGLLPVRLRGRGSMFESLRDYVPGDDLADVAWKATARHGRLITRNYETERSQNVLVMLDCGRLMVPQVDQLSRLDCAINADAAVELRGDEAGRPHRAGGLQRPPGSLRSAGEGAGGAGTDERGPVSAGSPAPRVRLRAGLQVPGPAPPQTFADRRS